MSERTDIQKLADELERLAQDARAVANATRRPPATGLQGDEAAWARIYNEPDTAQRASEASGQRAGTPLDDAERRLHTEVDRVVGWATRVLDRSVTGARLGVTRAERDACERILERTERACERIEAADHAQQRLLEVIAETRRRGAADR